MEITKDNFEDQLGNFTEDLNKACVVAFDAEFTAILTGEVFKYRLFDDNETRYNRLKTEVSKMIMTQVGLTMFHYNRDTDSYKASGYTFHLCPQSFGDVDQAFIFQASTLKFLCKHKFDFNKFIYYGLPYMSRVEEQTFRQDLKSKTLITKLSDSLSIDEDKELQEYLATVEKWITLEKDEECLYLDVEDPVLRYLTHHEVRRKFPHVLTSYSLGSRKKICVSRYKHVNETDSVSMTTIEDKFIDNLLGFSKVIQLLELSKKPIVGHNIVLDLVFLYNQFVGPLPAKYSVFKKNINTMFPKLYDTKYISHEMGRKLKFDEMWKSSKLQDLYEFFALGKCAQLRKGLNPISHKQELTMKKKYHEAGWDSYCSGYCFLRFGHWLACENSVMYRPVGPTETLAAVETFMNKVNVIRGAIPYMNLVGSDPKSHRPPLLYVQALGHRAINATKITNYLEGFGALDVTQYGHKAALIATGSKTTSGSLLTGSLLLYMLHKKYLNSCNILKLKL